MAARNSATSYGRVTRVFHWLTALLIFAAFPLGVIANDMAAEGAEAVALKTQLFSIHKTLGVAVFVVALARILWALTETKPVALHPDRKVETFLAELVHWALYLSLVVVPLSGWIHHAALDGFAPILWPFGQGLPFVPKSETVSDLASAVHWVFTKVLFASVALHIAGALKHALIDRDLVLARMAGGVSAGVPGRAHSLVPAGIALAIFAAGAVGAWSLAGKPADQTAAAPAATAAPGGNWQVQSGTIGLGVKQAGADVAGQLPAFAATIDFDEATGTGKVRVDIDMTQATLGAVTDQARGPEFFDVPNHPAAVFAADIAPAGDGFAATGTLTLRGKQVPVTLPFTLTITGDVAEMAGTVTLDRRDFGLGASYKDEATVGFPVAVTVTLTAKRQ